MATARCFTQHDVKDLRIPGGEGKFRVMVVVLIFAITLLLAVYISELAWRSVLSTAVLFLVAGFVVGDGILELVSL